MEEAKVKSIIDQNVVKSLQRKQFESKAYQIDAKNSKQEKHEQGY